jgi:hypothetical protein
MLSSWGAEPSGQRTESQLWEGPKPRGGGSPGSLKPGEGQGSKRYGQHM